MGRVKDNAKVRETLGMENSESWENAVEELRHAIFVELKGQGDNVVGIVVGKVLDSPLLKKGDKFDSYGLAELVNLIVAAAAIERESYDKLVELVKGIIVGVGDKCEFKDQIQRRLVTHCLVVHPTNTLLFLLLLVQKEVLNFGYIYHFLKRNEDANCGVAIALVYFAPEMLAYKTKERGSRKWSVHDAWRRIHDNFKGLFGILGVPDFETELFDRVPEAAWEVHKAKRISGSSDLPLLKVIKEDNAEELSTLLVQNNIELEIDFSMYEQYFHYNYNIVKVQGSQGEVECKPSQKPQILEAVGLLGAKRCWEVINGLELDAKQKKEAVNRALGALIATPKLGLGMEFIQTFTDEDIRVGHAVVAVIQNHNQDMLQILLAKKIESGEQEVTAAIEYANFWALKMLTELRNLDFELSWTDSEDPEVNCSLYDKLARCNAVLQFQYLLRYALQDSIKDVIINPHSKNSKGQNFLHRGASVGSAEILSFWLESWGLEGHVTTEDTCYNPYALLPYSGKVLKKEGEPKTEGEPKIEDKPYPEYSALYGQIKALVDALVAQSLKNEPAGN
jgi:hypothetical protein